MNEGLKQYGTYQENFVKLQDAIDSSIINGGATPEEYRSTLLQILKSTEALRLKSENELARLKEQIAYHQAESKACAMLSTVIVGIVNARARERQRVVEGYKIILQREISELEDAIAEAEAADDPEKVARLTAEHAQKKLAFTTPDAMPLGSEKERDVVTEAVSQAFRANLTANPVQPDRNPVQTVIEETLQDVPVNEMEVVTQLERKNRGKRKQ